MAGRQRGSLAGLGMIHNDRHHQRDRHVTEKSEEMIEMRDEK